MQYENIEVSYETHFHSEFFLGINQMLIKMRVSCVNILDGKPMSVFYMTNDPQFLKFRFGSRFLTQEKALLSCSFLFSYGSLIFPLFRAGSPSLTKLLSKPQDNFLTVKSAFLPE